MAILTTDGRCVTISLASGALLPGSIYLPPVAGSPEMVWVEVLDQNLASQGPIQFVNLTATLYYNAVGSWSMICPYSDFLWKMVTTGDFFVNINWRGLFSFGGKVEQPGFTDSIPGSTGGSGSANGPFITLAGGDYLALIANRIAYPNPTVAWASQTASSADAVSAMALETAIKHYVSRNAGSAALAARQVTVLDMATDQARGAAVSYTVKFGTGVDLNLMDLVRALIAQTNTAMGVSIARNPATHRLSFDCYVPRNLAGNAWFSEQLGNLTSVNFYLTDPTCTDALVQGASSFITAILASGSGGTTGGQTKFSHTELFIDSSSETDANNLKTTAQTALLTGAIGPTMSATVTDTPFLTFGRDYYLGDIVTLEVRPGATFSDVVSSVQLTADPSQTPMLNVVPTIGNSANATATDQSAIGQLTKRIQTLERKLATK